MVRALPGRTPSRQPRHTMENLTMAAVCYLAENAGINVLNGDEIDSTNPRTLTALYVALQIGEEGAPTMEDALAMNPADLFEQVSKLLEMPGKPVAKKKRAARKKS